MRPVYFCLGWIFFGLGIVGVFLPVLPTTPFMLLALWAFSNSSEKFHQWLYHHPVFGPPLQQWHEHGVIPLVAKVFAFSFMSLSMLYMLLNPDIPAWVNAMTAVFMATVAAWMISKPSRPPG
jgi:uncharacterized membrane protein YbaN (DUF454 family)